MINMIMTKTGTKADFHGVTVPQVDIDPMLVTELIESMDANNTFCPGIQRIIFNLKTTDTHAVRDEKGELVIDSETGKPKHETVKIDPVLATTIYFDDGTKVVAVNSKHDPVTLKEDGTASDASKEAGIVYAIVKRMFGEIDENGLVSGDGFGRKLRELVDMAYDPIIEERKNAEKKEANIKKHAEIAAKAKARKEADQKRYDAQDAEYFAKLATAIVAAMKSAQEAAATETAQEPTQEAAAK